MDPLIIAIIVAVSSVIPEVAAVDIDVPSANVIFLPCSTVLL